MKVLRSKIVKLCEALGFKTAGKWNRPKMEEKLRVIADTVKADEVDLTDGELKDLLVALIAQGGDVTVVAKEEELVEDDEEQEGANEGGEGDACPNCGATEKDADGDCAKCHEPAAAVKKGKKPAAKKEKVKGEAKEPKVRDHSTTRAYCVGAVIATAGGPSEFSKEDIERLVTRADEAYVAVGGKANPRETAFLFRNAVNILFGYTDQHRDGGK